MTGAQLAEAASGLVGAPFRLHGRDPRTGLDCLGVLAAACEALGRQTALPNGYALRMRRMPEASRIAAGLGLQPASGAVLPGDVLMLRPSPCQLHIAIAADARSLVHAHAGLRKVVRGPLPGDWPIAAHWRLPPPAPASKRN